MITKVTLVKLLLDAFSLFIAWWLVDGTPETLIFIPLFLGAIAQFVRYRGMLKALNVNEIILLLLISVGFMLIHSLYLGQMTMELVFFYVLSFVGLISWRLIIYAYRNNFPTSAKNLLKGGKTVILVGAGEATQIYLDMNISPDAYHLGIVDDNLTLKGRAVAGVQVLGPIKDIPMLLETYHIDQIVYMIPSINITKHQPFFNIIQTKYPHIEILTTPSLSDINYGLKSISELSNLNLLTVNNTPKDLTLSPSTVKQLHEKIIMITGGCGSIGSVLVRQLLDLQPTCRVVVIEHSELALYNLQEQCQDDIDSQRLTLYLGDYADLILLRSILKKHKPTMVFHAAAYKHVNILEKHNAFSAVYNNCIKSIAFAEELKNHTFIKTLLLVSTDKAVHPSNVMGKTKRIVEASLQSIFHGTHIHLVITRFGNVVGSKGSVFHKFLRQIENRQKITLTDKRVTRYFMNITQAANLLIQVSLIGKGSQVYVLNMGQPVSMYDFLVSMIKKYGTEAQLDDIVITGLREGEKQQEELYYEHEQMKALDEHLFVGSYGDLNFQVDEFKTFFDSLEDHYDEAALKKYLDSLGIF